MRPATRQQVCLIPRTTRIIWAKITNVCAEKGIMFAERIGQKTDAMPHGDAIDIQKHEFVMAGERGRAITGCCQWQTVGLEPIDMDVELGRWDRDRIIAHIDDDQLIRLKVATPQTLYQLC
jgi:hypothetical protein